ncbi:hypothetical protein F4X10_12405 [Candidatus Poribacteria bacterium]|nr:hypothetical protein [Candidatus Poribacteria bacterium]
MLYCRRKEISNENSHFCSIFFCAIALPAFSELTDADLDKIRLIVKEEIKPLKADIETLKITVARFAGRITGIEGRMTGMEERSPALKGASPVLKNKFRMQQTSLMGSSLSL